MSKNNPSRRTRIVNLLLESFLRAGVFDATRFLTPNTLTVLNYHRIDDPFRKGFDTFKPNVSATPVSFARQMDYVKEKYNVVDCGHIAAWLRGAKSLPPHAAIITFDDGYYDNFANAFPVLKERNLSAVIFLTTDFIGGKAPFYWDFVAACFFYTQRDYAYLPLLGTQSWPDEASREVVMHRWIELIKKLPEEEKRNIIQSADDILGVSVPAGALSDLHLSWSQVREMNHMGIEFGSHTVSHPILTRIPVAVVKDELETSKKQIEDQTGKQVISFAYPNGHVSDLSPDIVTMVREAGYQVSYTLLPGPTSYSAVRNKPFEIRRIYLGYRDSFPIFVSKLAGVARLLNR